MAEEAESSSAPSAEIAIGARFGPQEDQQLGQTWRSLGFYHRKMVILWRFMVKLWRFYGDLLRFDGLYPLVMTDIAIENGPFIVSFPIESGDVP